jgi:TonB family protein
MTRLSLALAAALVASPIAAAAQQQPPAPAAPARPPGPWQVDWGQYYCSMIRRSEPGRPFHTAFVMTPGGTATGVTLVPEAGQQAPGDVDTLVLLPGGAPMHVSSNDDRRRERRITLIRYYGLPPGFRDALSGARELQLRHGDQVRATVPLGGIGNALASLRQCSATVSREWGLDEAALAALSRRPTTTNALGLEVNDYPEAALRTATQGQVTARVGVSAEGRATECAIVASSGSPAIDNTVCHVAMTRGRYDPALDAAGRPVAMRSTFTATFRLPED